MALLERHRFMVNRLAEAFNRDENEIEKMMLQYEVLKDINFFFTESGPNKILVGLEAIPEEELLAAIAPPEVSDNEEGGGGEENEVIVPKEEPLTHRLKVYFEEIDCIPSTFVYFMKNKKGKDQDVSIYIDPSKANDGLLSFGVMRAPLESLEAMIRVVYKPLIQQMGPESWGEALAEHKSDLISSIDIFTKGLQESIRSISGGLELKKPDERIENLGAGAASDPTLVVHAMNLLQEWCVKIEKYLDDSDRSRWETTDSGPDTELIYWRSRTQR